MRMGHADIQRRSGRNSGKGFPAAVSTRLCTGLFHWRLGFWSLIVHAVSGGVHDNALKFLVIYSCGAATSLPLRATGSFCFVGALFALLHLFSLAAGILPTALASARSHRTKIFEIGVMIFALLSLAVEISDGGQRPFF